jgi:hypothetical protein
MISCSWKLRGRDPCFSIQQLYGFLRACYEPRSAASGRRLMHRDQGLARVHAIAHHSQRRGLVRTLRGDIRALAHELPSILSPGQGWHRRANAQKCYKSPHNGTVPAQSPSHAIHPAHACHRGLPTRGPQQIKHGPHTCRTNSRTLHVDHGAAPLCVYVCVCARARDCVCAYVCESVCVCL